MTFLSNASPIGQFGQCPNLPQTGSCRRTAAFLPSEPGRPVAEGGRKPQCFWWISLAHPHQARGGPPDSSRPDAIRRGPANSGATARGSLSRTDHRHLAGRRLEAFCSPRGPLRSSQRFQGSPKGSKVRRFQGSRRVRRFQGLPRRRVRRFCQIDLPGMCFRAKFVGGRGRFAHSDCLRPGIAFA